MVFNYYFGSSISIEYRALLLYIRLTIKWFDPKMKNSSDHSWIQESGTVLNFFQLWNQHPDPWTVEIQVHYQCQFHLVSNSLNVFIAVWRYICFPLIICWTVHVHFPFCRTQLTNSRNLSSINRLWLNIWSLIRKINGCLVSFFYRIFQWNF